MAEKYRYFFEYAKWYIFPPFNNLIEHRQDFDKVHPVARMRWRSWEANTDLL